MSIIQEQYILKLASREFMAGYEEGDALAWLKSLCSSIQGYHYEIIESGYSGYTSYAEVMIGPPSEALAVRACTYGPYFALGHGSYSISRPGEVSGYSSLTLSLVDEYVGEFNSIVDQIERLAEKTKVSRVRKRELSRQLTDESASFISSLLPRLEGRKAMVLYDALFQFQD